MARSIYTKLTGRHRSLFGFSQLWLAPDHVMLLQSSRFTEQYKRFALSDIQSIVVTELPPRAVAQAVIILAALAWMGLWFTVDSRFAKWVIEISGTLALLIAIVDIARGQRCRCVLHTRVSREPLEPVSRMRIARRFLAEIRPRIEALQGVLPPTLEPFPLEPFAPEAPPPETPSSPGYLPEIVFGLFLANALMIWALMRFPQAADLSGVLLTTMFAELLLIATAFLRRKGRDGRVIVYAVMALGILGIAYGFYEVARELVGWYMTVLEKARNNDHSITPVTIFTNPNRAQAIAVAWRAIAGVIGLGAAFYERRSKWPR
ncbi:MAG TPA: hypothetical protein VMT15_17700 [Bryobacteraceae bacterium]|nr:hypothetical protein [Bryobacteraceae bacterium]